MTLDEALTVLLRAAASSHDPRMREAAAAVLSEVGQTRGMRGGFLLPVQASAAGPPPPQHPRCRLCRDAGRIMRTVEYVRYGNRAPVLRCSVCDDKAPPDLGGAWAGPNPVS